MQTMEIGLWTYFKELVTTKSLSIQYVDTDVEYRIYASEDRTYLWFVVVQKGSEDATDFETNFKATANAPIEKRSYDNIERVATALYQVEDSFYIQGKKITVPISSTSNIEYQFAYDIKMIGVLTQWKSSDEGDLIEASVGYYDGENWIEIMKYGETLYLVNGNSVDISTNDYASIPAGLVVRIAYTNVSDTNTKFFVTWMKCYR